MAEVNNAEFVDRLISVNRVAKVIKGGRRFAFSALVCVGDQKGTIGIGSGKAREVARAVAKATAEAYKNLFHVPRIGSTIPHPVQARKNAGEVLLKPASAGTGVIAGGPVRAILECAGIHDILSKSLGSQNAINVVQATVQALKSLEQIDSVAQRRKKDLRAVAPHYLVAQFEKDQAAQAEGATDTDTTKTSDDKNTDKSDEKTTDKTTDKSNEKTTDKNTDKTDSKTASTTTSKVADKSSGKTESESSRPTESKS
jgi:small subunit ribosomal protein S5